MTIMRQCVIAALMWGALLAAGLSVADHQIRQMQASADNDTAFSYERLGGIYQLGVWGQQYECNAQQTAGLLMLATDELMLKTVYGELVLPLRSSFTIAQVAAYERYWYNAMSGVW